MRELTYVSGMINDVDCSEVGTGGVADEDQSAALGEGQSAGRVASARLVRFADLCIAPYVKQRH